MSDYILPEVWENPVAMGGAWGGINQPTAGARFEQTLPKGNQPFQLYTLPTPNGIKATIMLEELKELGVTQAGYDAYRIKIGDGDQFGSDFVATVLLWKPNANLTCLIKNLQPNLISLGMSTLSLISQSGLGMADLLRIRFGTRLVSSLTLKNTSIFKLGLIRSATVQLFSVALMLIIKRFNLCNG